MSGEPSTMGNNRIRDTRYLNQYSRQQKPFLKLFFLRSRTKILFQRHRRSRRFLFRGLRIGANAGAVDGHRTP